jgi:hypothetical protein
VAALRTRLALGQQTARSVGRLLPRGELPLAHSNGAWWAFDDL